MASTNHDNRQHAVLAPSSMKMLMACEASLIPPPHELIDIPSPYAEEGTRAHELLETTLLAPTKELAAGYLSEHEKEDAEMVEHVHSLYMLIQRILNKIGRDRIFKVVTESRVSFSEHIYGTLDFAVLYVKDGTKRVYMLDFKYGQGTPVPAEHNAQLLTYLAALCKTHDWDAKIATLAIYQPRNFEASDKPLDQWQVSEKEIKDWGSKLRRFEKKALKILSGNSKKKLKETVGDHCKFCKRKPVCRSYAEYASADGLILLHNSEPLPQTQNGDSLAAITPQQLSDEQLSTIITNADTVRKFLKACESYAAARYVSGNPLPGFKMVAGRSSRVWIDDTDRVAEALTAQGIDPFKISLIGITEAERQAGKGKLSYLTIKPPGKPKLVSLADERQALEGLSIQTAVDMLDDLEE